MNTLFQKYLKYKYKILASGREGYIEMHKYVWQCRRN